MKNLILILFSAVSFHAASQTTVMITDLLYAQGQQSTFNVAHIDINGNMGVTRIEENIGDRIQVNPTGSRTLSFPAFEPGRYQVFQENLFGDMVQLVSVKVE